MSKSRSTLLGIFVVAVAYNMIRFWEFSIDPDSSIGYSPYLKNATAFPAYSTVYCVFMYLITHFLAPFTLLLALNSHVIGTIVQARKARANMSR